MGLNHATEVETLYRRALPIYESCYKSDPSAKRQARIARCLNNLAEHILRKEEKHASETEAEAMHRRARDIYSTLQVETQDYSYEYCKSLTNLARLLCNKGPLEASEAKKLLSQALSIFELSESNVKDEQRADVAEKLKNLRECLQMKCNQKSGKMQLV